ncbi:MAG TPA: nuclear transport factor 2 family protein [Gemmatimonadales bacterium]|nr:nuclear transport factor 2 family protein [Gemmatimonadales bacterium]
MTLVAGRAAAQFEGDARTMSKERIGREANPPVDAGNAERASLAAIDSLAARFMAAYDRDDAAAIVALHTADARFVSDGRIDYGRATLERGWRRSLPEISGLKITLLERAVSGDLATEIIRFTQQYRHAGKTVTDSGYAVSVLRREPDGAWRYHTHALSRIPGAP